MNQQVQEQVQTHAQTRTQTQSKKVNRAGETLSRMVEAFSNETFPRSMAAAYITGAGKPSSKWSLMNRTIMVMNGTHDARGYKQWWKAGRYVKKGSKAFYIVKVRTVKRTRTDKNGKEVEEEIPVGTVGIPVFRYEDTAGEPLVKYEPAKPLPLREVAEKWGLKVVYDETINGEMGSFNQSTNTIRLCTKDDPATFFHELAHKAHSKIEKTKGGQDPRQETVAELAACVLSEVYGYDSRGESWNYIAGYAGEKTPEAVGRACMGVVSTVQKVLDLILAESARRPDQSPSA